MDGFHLAQTELERLGRADRKGAPDTFDAAGSSRCSTAARAAGGTVYAPEYRRDLRNPVAGAIAVPPRRAARGRRGQLPAARRRRRSGAGRGLLDETWYLEPPDDVRLTRLVARHEAFGKSPEAARAWSLGPDERNARLVAATRGRADVVVRPLTHRGRLGAVSHYPARAVVDLAAIRANVRALAAHAPTAAGHGRGQGRRVRPRARADAPGRRSPAGRRGSARHRSPRRWRCGAAGVDRARVLTWLYAPGAPLRDVVDGRRRRGRRRAWALDEVAAAARAAGRPARVHLKVDTGPGPQRADAGRPAGDPARGRCGCRPRAPSRSSGSGRTSRSPTSPTHPTVKLQVEVFADAIGRRGGRRRDSRCGTSPTPRRR